MTGIFIIFILFYIMVRHNSMMLSGLECFLLLRNCAASRPK